jgi:hypothetical protein
MLGLGAGLVVTFIALGIAGRHRRLVVSATASLLAVAAVYGLFFALVANRPSMEPFWVQHENLRHLFCSSETARFQLWKAAWDGFVHKPLLGWGPGGLESAFDAFFQPAYHPLGYQDKAHNVPLGVLCETGAIGAVAYLAVGVGFVLAVVRAGRTGALTWLEGAALLGAGAGYFVYSLFAPDGLATDLMVAVTFAVVAASTAASEQDAVGSAVPSRMSPTKRLVLLGLVSASALAVLSFGSLSPFLSSYFAKKAMDGASRKSGAELVALLEKAQRFPTPYVDDRLSVAIGIAEDSVQSSTPRTSAQQDAFVSYALKRAEEYLHGNPVHARYRSHLADALATIGRATGRAEIVGQAEALYRQSIAESPARQLYRFAYAKFLTQARRLDEAEAQYRQTVAAAPGMGEALWSLGRFLWTERNQADEGSRLMVSSQEVAPYDRFWPPAPLEFLQLAQALARQQKNGELHALADTLQRALPNDPLAAKACVEIAKVMEDVGLIPERNQVLQLGIKRNSLLAASFDGVLGGGARLRDGVGSKAMP